MGGVQIDRVFQEDLEKSYGQPAVEVARADCDNTKEHESKRVKHANSQMHPCPRRVVHTRLKPMSYPQGRADLG
eukprot:5039902-Amphidinium_carterae.1